VLVVDFNKATIKITDFGLSAESTHRSQVTEFIASSPAYQAPELPKPR
jgi:serine/threonine protein kinase